MRETLAWRGEGFFVEEQPIVRETVECESSLVQEP